MRCVDSVTVRSMVVGETVSITDGSGVRDMLSDGGVGRDNGSVNLCDDGSAISVSATVRVSVFVTISDSRREVYLT